MEVEYQATPQDELALLYHLGYHSPGARDTRRTLFVVYGLCLILFCGFFLLDFGHWGPELLWPSLVTILLTAWILGRRQLDGLFWKWRLSRQAAGFPVKIHLRIGPDGLTTVGEGSAITYRWVAVQNIRVTDTHAFFDVGPKIAIVLPRSAFAQAEAFTAFLEAARRYRAAALEGQAAAR